MKRTQNSDNLYEYPNKKHKINIMPLKPIDSLQCDICKTPVYNYQYCLSAFVYCSMSCLTILILRKMNDQERTSFEDKSDDLMLF